MNSLVLVKLQAQGTHTLVSFSIRQAQVGAASVIVTTVVGKIGLPLRVETGTKANNK